MYSSASALVNNEVKKKKNHVNIKKKYITGIKKNNNS